ncbi:multidrug DMT transporter permease [Xaviernesmea oryzae]|uniref:Multidrug DMT transporter permease n=2 Tax=Xaviernesmea oryzae TaxID=464029 RepID=A0A1Q9AYE8_9HYPH|nr:multidrug DMT transporter permease [Xaviernesmea oryzae]
MPESATSARMGVAFMLAGMLMFSLNDVLGKWLAASHSAFQVMTVRSLAALLVLSPFMLRLGWRRLVRVEQPYLHVVRALFFSVDALAFYYCVAFMPLADAMTYWLAVPIYVAAASPFLLGKKVGWRRWLAILVGFSGVLIALNPSSASFSLPALVALGGSLAYGGAVVLGRKLREAPDVTLVTWQVVSALISASVGLAIFPESWSPVSPVNLGLLGLLGIVALCAHIFVNRSLKLADAATVVPLQYTLLFWAVLFGWLIFSDVPRPTTVIGAVLIVLSGLFIFFREQTVKRAAQRTQVTEVL